MNSFNSFAEEQPNEADEAETKDKANNMVSIETNTKINNQNVNNDFNIDNIYETNHVKNQMDEISEIIDKLNNESDLNFLIESINTIRMKENRKIFDKNHLLVSLNSKEVDKFFTEKNQHKNFSVDVSFQLS